MINSNIIQEQQSYQIERDRDRDIIVPFLNARDYILRVQTGGSFKENRENLIKASDELTRAINSLYSDMETSARSLDRLTKFPIFQIKPLIQKRISFLTQDLQLVTKYVGVQMQVFEYLDESGKRDA